MKKNKNKNFWIISLILAFAFVANNANAGTRGLIQQIKQKVEYIKDKPSIVFLITKDSNNYEADKTIPIFAEMLRSNMAMMSPYFWVKVIMVLIVIPAWKLLQQLTC